jgi:Rps23 Pro-64 3,4-dihydroxylase Tpa1-like proline 4-hydroxylase
MGSTYAVENAEPFKKEPKNKEHTMKKNYIMARCEVDDLFGFLKRAKHNYRSYSNIQSIRNDKTNFRITDGIFEPFSQLNTSLPFIAKRFKKLFDDNKKEHRKLFEKTKGYKLKGTAKSTVEGVVAFSQFNTEKFTEYDLMKISIQVEENLKQFAKDKGTELQDLVLHLDERDEDNQQGEFHFHFIMKNYNQKGESLQLSTGRQNSSELQDYIARNLEQFQISRGEKGSKKKHLSIKEFQEQQDTIREMRIEMQKLITDINFIIEEVVATDTNTHYKKKVQNLILNLQKYIKQDNIKGLEKLLQRAEKIEKSAKKNTNLPNNKPPK